MSERLGLTKTKNRIVIMQEHTAYLKCLNVPFGQQSNYTWQVAKVSGPSTVII